MTVRKNLCELIKQLAIVRARVTLASGRVADYYVDMRAVTLDGRSASLVGEVMLETTADWQFDCVGGLTMGADPVALAMVQAATRVGRHLDAFVVRKEAKSHGLQKRIEGPSVTGRRCLVVEDTSTTGGSPLSAVTAVREAGGEVVGVAVVVDRSAGAAEAIEAMGLSYRFAYGLTDLGLTAM
ncbi:MAG: orotate phosphoribosyltransferase [Propionibacteriaceae bacterium]|jgi:orotate phosphoribosyltransferase|nr:orotate phosphoribosyltransferase [Propionibacteriaceae bacterium]